MLAFIVQSPAPSQYQMPIVQLYSLVFPDSAKKSQLVLVLVVSPVRLKIPVAVESSRLSAPSSSVALNVNEIYAMVPAETL